jgi:hypothetical protein
MPGVPDDARLKLDRAKQHIQLLNAAVAHFGERDPYGEESELEGAPGLRREYVMRFKMNRQPPREWSETIGDCLHNLRASLDYLVWALWIESSGVPTKPQDVMFPIVGERSSFARARQVRIAGLPASAQDAIERLQPFHAAEPAQHPLSVLQELNNHDKHRFLRTAVAAVAKAELDVTEREMAVVEKYTLTEGIVNDGDELFRATLRSLGRGPRLGMVVRTTYTIAFDQGEPGGDRQAVPLLEEIRLYIRDVVFPTLSPHFR